VSFIFDFVDYIFFCILGCTLGEVLGFADVLFTEYRRKEYILGVCIGRSANVILKKAKFGGKHIKYLYFEIPHHVRGV
jgi:hypothetical protein